MGVKYQEKPASFTPYLKYPAYPPQRASHCILRAVGKGMEGKGRAVGIKHSVGYPSPFPPGYGVLMIHLRLMVAKQDPEHKGSK